MQMVTWDAIATETAAALEHCRRLGLVDLVARSRFAVYQQRIAALREALAQGGQDAARALFVADRLTNSVALTESAALVALVPFLRACAPAVVRPKLERILTGPVQPIDEGENSSRGRNTLFELNLAAKLWTAGLAPELAEHPDLRCDVDGRRLLIECKRPTSMGGARKAIARARHQLVKHLRRAPAGARGVIALSVTKLLNRGDQLLVYRGEPVGRSTLNAALDECDRALTDSYAGLSDQIMGLLLHAITPGLDEASGLPVVAQSMIIHGLLRKSRDDARELEIIYDRIYGQPR